MLKLVTKCMVAAYERVLQFDILDRDFTAHAGEGTQSCPWRSIG